MFLCRTLWSVYVKAIIPSPLSYAEYPVLNTGELCHNKAMELLPNKHIVYVVYVCIIPISWFGVKIFYRQNSTKFYILICEDKSNHMWRLHICPNTLVCCPILCDAHTQRLNILFVNCSVSEKFSYNFWKIVCKSAILGYATIIFSPAGRSQ